MIDPDHFWRLLPMFHQRRDVETGGPLRALLQVLAEQAALLDADITRQYNNWFIETCEDWAVPYIGDLIGYRPVHDTGDPSATLKPEDEALRRTMAPRREVANTIRYRSRKGTLALLDQLAADVAGWPAKAVEFRNHIVTAQHMRVPRPTEAGTTSIRRVPLAAMGGAEDALPRLAEVRRISVERGATRYGPNQIGLFVARHLAMPIIRATAACLDEAGAHCFLFNPLGFDMPLYRKADPGAAILPGPLTRTALTQAQDSPQPEAVWADPATYGEQGSVMVWIRPTPGAPLQEKTAQNVVPADLRRWDERPASGHVALDPENGRLMFPEGEVPDQVVVSYHESALGDLGASARPRRLSTRHRAFFAVGGGEAGRDGETHNSLQAAIETWRTQGPADALIEIRDSGTYDEQRLSLALGPGQHLEIRAAQGERPLLRVVDYEASRDDAWRIAGSPGSALVLDGLLIAARRLNVRGNLGSLLLRRCTLVPGSATRGGDVAQATGTNLLLDNARTSVRIQHCILGPIHVRDNEMANEPLDLEVTDSVIDSGGGDAILGPGSIAAHMALTIRRSTVIGRCAVHEILLAEDAIFTGAVMVARRQRGCIRFCYLPPHSRTPRRFECIPSLSAGTDESPFVPVFVGLHYGQPGYCQLSQDCPAEIRRGASDQGELGVFHNLFQPQREANLRARLAEYVPAAVDVDVIYLT